MGVQRKTARDEPVAGAVVQSLNVRQTFFRWRLPWVSESCGISG